MIEYLSIIEIDKVNHTVETDMVKLVVEIECFGMSFDEFDKETMSSDGLQPKQAVLSCVHALKETHLHEIHVVPSKHEADQQAIQADCDIKETNIILQGLPPEVYALSPQSGSPYQSQQYSTHQSSTPLSITYPSNDYQSSIHHNVYSPSSFIPQLKCAPTVNQQSEFSQPDSGLIVPVFQKGDDLIDAINHMMSFLTAIFKDKVLLVQAQASGQILHEEELAFLADPGIPEGQATHTVITHNDAYQADDLDAYDSDCDELNTAIVCVSVEILSPIYGSMLLLSDSNIIPYSQYVIESQQAAVQNS
ncbi:hypothetical protein Tco_1539283 [Tanacetum coccineum]